MPTSSVELPARFAVPGAFRVWPVGLLAAVAWLALGLFTANWPNAVREWPLTQALASACLAFAGLLTLAALSWRYWRVVWPGLHGAGPWLLAAPLLLGVWQLLTAKLGWLPVPFFAPPQALLEVYLEDWQRLGESLWASLALLFTGVAFSVLVVAEMIGVKAGIGFYLQWAQGWAAYANMYAALLLMALLCSGLISGLFLLRDRLLAWQKGTVQW
ncbi:hypothetical protein D3C78_506630 [compost metagenome]